MVPNEISSNSLQVMEARYLWPDEDWQTLSMKRVGTILASREKDQAYWSEKMGGILYERKFIYGGRILRNAGRLQGNLANCFNVPLHDKIESIGEFIKNILVLWKHGGGIGTFADLRPRGAELKSYGGQSSGLVSFFKAFDAVGSTIESGGQRRAAGLGLVDVSHPELFDFLDAKLQTADATVLKPEIKEAVKRLEKMIYEHGTSQDILDWIAILAEITKKLTHFNLSVAINNHFLEMVERKNGWPFTYNMVKYGEMPADVIWHELIKRMVEWAEPSLINWSNFQKNNSYYFAPITGTNACSELCLEDFGVCNLGSIVLPRFVAQRNTKWKDLEETVRTAVRAMDNVIDVNHYVLPEIESAALNARRVGIGVMGLSDYFFIKRIRYGSQESLNEIERVWKFIRNTAYEESVKIASEKGSFPKFDGVSYGKASFIRKLPQSLRMDIKKYGIRNCTLLAGAPTGTTSLIADVNSGIEALFSKAYLRRDNVSDRYYIHPIYAQYLNGERTELPEWFVDAHDVTPSEHLDVLTAALKYVDSNISKTINLPKGTTVEEVEKLLLEYSYDIKGTTIYVDGSRDEQVLYSLSEEDARKNLKEADEIQDFICTKGVCEI